MMTENEIRNRVMSENPEPQYSTINGEQVEISGPEYLAMIDAFVAMKLVQQEAATRAEVAATATAAAVAHAKSLGFTDEMIAVMYPNLVP
jgi:hypothetical protein